MAYFLSGAPTASPDGWYGAHNSVGQTTAATLWTLAEGRVGGPEGYQTFILLANPHPSATAQVTVTFLRDDGDDTVTKVFDVPPSSRVTVSVDLWQVPEIERGGFGASIQSTLPIVVERSMYSTIDGQVWVAGTNAAGTAGSF